MCPPIDQPSADDIRAAAEKQYLNLSDREVDLFRELLTDRFGSYTELDRLTSDIAPGVADAEREPGYRPDSDEDTYNSYVTRCLVSNSADGSLSGMKVGIKDNTAVAGVEMTAASDVLQGYVPLFDATVVRRLLDEGGDITGKMNMDAMAKGGTGEWGVGGPILNPHDTAYLAGGTSGGCAAGLVADEIDLAVGTDAAGSVRIPSAWCGCVGLKPTHGLVPLTGVIPSGPTYDHVGPMARTVGECALGLDVIAGADQYDPRQNDIEPETYASALGEHPETFTVGVVSEGFWGESPAVDETVRNSLSQFEASGATVRDVSVPLHEHGETIWGGISSGSGLAMYESDLTGKFLDGYYDLQFLQVFSKLRRAAADRFEPKVKLSLIAAQYVRDQTHGYYYAKAQNLRADLRRAYDSYLDSVDVLAMPTVPVGPFEVKEEWTTMERLTRPKGKYRKTNTSPFNVTGHPAISVPCGEADGLPVGLMFVGSRNADRVVLQVADAFERHVPA